MYIVRTARIKRRQGRHHAAADGWIGRWIGGRTIEIGKFQRMRVNRHLTVGCQAFQRASMIEMAIGHDDGHRTIEIPKPLIGGSLDKGSATRDTGVHQHPFGGSRRAYEDHIHMSSRW